MRLRSFLGLALIALAGAVLFAITPILDLTAFSADPVSLDTAFMFTVAIGVLVIAIVALSAVLKDRSRMVYGRVGIVGRHDSVYRDIDGVWRRSLGFPGF